MQRGKYSGRKKLFSLTLLIDKQQNNVMFCVTRSLMECGIPILEISHNNQSNCSKMPELKNNCESDCFVEKKEKDWKGKQETEIEMIWGF